MLRGDACVLGGGGLVGCLALGGRVVGRLCATFGVAFGFRLGGRCRLRRDGRGEFLNALPEGGGRRLWDPGTCGSAGRRAGRSKSRAAASSAKTWPVRQTPVGC